MIKINITLKFDKKLIWLWQLILVVQLIFRWCNPCRMLTPRLETVIAEKQGKILLAKVDIDENTDLALDYEV